LTDYLLDWPLVLDFVSPWPLRTLASYLFDLPVDLAGEVEVMGILQRVSKHTQINLRSLSLSFWHFHPRVLVSRMTDLVRMTGPRGQKASIALPTSHWPPFLANEKRVNPVQCSGYGWKFWIVINRDESCMQGLKESNQSFYRIELNSKELPRRLGWILLNLTVGINHTG
jgi:hypothetical protein